MSRSSSRGINGKLTGTLLLLVLMVVEVTDLVFAVDSIPAIFAITTRHFHRLHLERLCHSRPAFDVFSARGRGREVSLSPNWAGDRSDVHRRERCCVVAVGFHIPIWFSLVFVAVVLVGSVVASLLIPPRRRKNR